MVLAAGRIAAPFRMLERVSGSWTAPGTLGVMRTQWFYGNRPGSSRVGC